MSRIIGDAALVRAFAPIESYPSAALAVSGGPDSMALMCLARRWLSLLGRGPESVTVLTVDHGLRPESAAEAAFVAAQAMRLGLAHATLIWAGEKPKTGIQAAARRARYGLMTAHCRAHQIACLATAHTEDDQAETFLMRLGRGSGLDGLAGMAPVSEWAGLPLVRPLLGFSKARLLAYLRAGAILYVSDPSNANLAFERVRLRLAIKALAASGIASPAIAHSASRLGRAREALSYAAAGFLERHFAVASLGDGEIGLEAFLALPDEIALRVLSRALELIGGKDESPRMIKVERLLEGVRGRQREAALGGCLVIKEAKALRLYREPGRMQRTPLMCPRGSSCVWDGRFVVSLPSGLGGAVPVAPLGAEGWAICQSAMKERGRRLQANRLAALSTPALWQNGSLLAAPALNYADPQMVRGESPPMVELVPRLSHFLKAA